MNTWPPGDDESLVDQLRAVYRREVRRAERANAAVALSPRVRPTGLRFDGLMRLGVIAVVVAAAIVAGQRGLSPSTPTAPTGSAAAVGGSQPVGASASPSSGETGTSRTFIFSAYEWLRSPVQIEVIDHSGLVASARGIGAFELIPPAKSGLAAVNRPPDRASTSVVVLWPASSCDRQWKVTVEKAARSISIQDAGAGTTHCADLTGRAIVLEFSTPIDASRVAVSFVRQ